MAKRRQLKPIVKPEDLKTGKAMRGAREKKGMKQQFVASRMLISPSMLCRLEKGERPWTPALIKSCKMALHIA